MDALKNRTPEEIGKSVLDSGLRGRGGAASHRSQVGFHPG